MTAWEGRILAALAESYPGSAAARGGRELRLRGEDLFPDFGTAAPDDRESFLEAAEALEAAGLVRLQWRGRRGEELRALILSDPEALFLRLGRRSPAEEAEEARAAALRCASASAYAPGFGNPGTEFFEFLARRLGPQDAAAGITARSVNELGRLFSALADLPRLPEAGAEPLGRVDPLAGLTPRALSVRLYADSKRLERLLSLFKLEFQKAGREGLALPDLSFLERSFPETLVAGRLSFSAAGYGTLENGTGLVLGLPWQTARQLTAIRPLDGNPAPRALGVENKESFHALAGAELGFDCVFYAAGHPNPAVRAVAKALAVSGFKLYHAGDLDPDGILILQEMQEAAGSALTPVFMDAATFERYRAYGRRLDGSMMERVSRISDEILAIPGIRGLVERILATGLSVEQEIIDYRAGL